MSVKWEWAIVPAIIGIVTLLYTTFPGDVAPLEPSSFAVIQGIGHFQSDHIVVPIEWINHGGQQALVRPTRLTLTNSTKNSTNMLSFELAGELLGGSSSNEPGHVGEYYTLKQAFIIAPHAITPTTMVFHVEDWWTDKNRRRGSAFTFKNNTPKNISSYNVSIDYSYVSFWDIPFLNSEQSATKKNIPLFKMIMRNWIRELNYEEYRWDASSTELNVQNKSWWQSRPKP